MIAMSFPPVGVLVPIYLIVHGIIFAKLAEISQRVPS
jgi:hypothetical protein